MPTLLDWLQADALPLWWSKGADHVRGGFHESLGVDGEPAGEARRARVIGRQIFVYATAAEAGLPGPWREAAAHGLSYMQSRFLRPDGLIRATLTPQGEPLDDRVILYDQAFCLFALAAAAGIGLDADRQAGAAEQLHDQLLVDWRNPAGGFVERDDHPYQANAHMHLFEASLAWEAVMGADPRGRRWADQADAIGELALSRFIDPVSGGLLEFFDAQWRPAPGVDGTRIEPGHLFEWAWLLMRWAKLRGREDAAAAARRLQTLGVGHGIDPVRGVAMDAIATDLSVVSDRARLWPQTERIKAAAILGQFAETGDERAFQAAEVAAGANGLWLYLQTPIPGLWRDKLLADGTFVDEPSPASSLYHIACAILDARARGFPV